MFHLQWPKFQQINILNYVSIVWVSLVLFEGITISVLIRNYFQIKEDNKNLRNSLVREIRLREEERSGRIALQQKARYAVKEKIAESGYSYQPIGIIECPFPNRCGTPVLFPSIFRNFS